VGGDFQSEKVLSYELGWRFQPLEKLSLSMASFYNIYSDIRSVEPGPNTFPATFGNGVKGTTRGVELSAACQPAPWWRLRGGYTFLRKDMSLKSGSHDTNNASAESNDPHNQYLVQSMMDVPGGIEFGLVLRYVDVLPKPYIPPYSTLDVRIGWKIVKNLELNMIGQNLLAGQHAEFDPTSPSPRKIARGVFGKMICRF
jgi:iron complex outermembrane receptor protein